MWKNQAEDINLEISDFKQKSLNDIIWKKKYDKLYNGDNIKFLDSRNGSGLALLPGQNVSALTNDEFSSAIELYIGNYQRRLRPMRRADDHHHGTNNPSIVGCNICTKITERHNNLVHILKDAALSCNINCNASPKQNRIYTTNNSNAVGLQTFEPSDFSATIRKKDNTTYNLSMDFSVVDPFADAFKNKTVQEAFASREKQKNDYYKELCQRDGITFKPVVFSAYGVASANAIDDIRSVLKKDSNLCSKVLQLMNLEILKFGGLGLRKYYRLDEKRNR